MRQERDRVFAWNWPHYLSAATVRLAESRSLGSHRAVTAHQLPTHRPKRGMPVLSCLLAALAVQSIWKSEAQAEKPRYAIAMHGEPAMPESFALLPYANPAAPKGGRLVQGVLGTFDSLNPLIVKGIALSQIRGLVVESLMARGYDEPFTLYGLVANAV